MFVVMAVEATEEELNAVRGAVLEEGLTPHENRGGRQIVIAVLGEGDARLARVAEQLARLPGVASVKQTASQYKLASRDFHPEDTVIDVNGVRVGDGSFTLMAGPCSVETRDQLFETADAVKAAGATVLRGGAFKPRTSPYSLPGARPAGPPASWPRPASGPACRSITEVMEPGQVEHVAEYADILQIGARNMQNYSLLMAVGQDRPARPPQARPLGHDRGMADGRRVRHVERQPERDPVRARHPDLRDGHPQHARHHGRAADPPADPPAGR